MENAEFGIFKNFLNQNENNCNFLFLETYNVHVENSEYEFIIY